MSLDKFFKKWDARYGIPRHANSLHLDSYQAGLRMLRDIGEGATIIAASLISCLIWWKIGEMLLGVGIEIRLYLPFVYLGIALICAFDLARIALPYYRLTQPVTHGSARWAEVRTLEGEGLAFDNREPLPAGALRLGRIGRRYDLALPYEKVMRHAAIFGPPGSGKSSSFFMSMAKDWSRYGSAIFLDPKGELFRYTAQYYKRFYRLDLADPRLSDRWNFVPACRGDAELAHEIASIIVGYDANKNVAYDPFWPQAETALAASLLMHLPQIASSPTPAHISEFIAARGFDEINHEMLNSPDPEARVKWGVFKKADREKTQGGVYIGLGTKLDPFRSPHAMAVMQSVSEEERERGLREIDLGDLRKAGTGIYVVIPEGDAARYRIVLSILFGLAASIARKTSDDKGGAPVLLALDEAGNIPLHNLAEALGVGRGRRCGIVLGYQNIGQLYKQHGRDGAQAILGSIGTQVFLPGLDSETAQYAARRIGRTTVLQHRSVDATGTMFDHEGQTEAGRDLLDAAELRQMLEHTQAVAIIGSAPPVRFRFPECAKNGRQAHALPRELARPVTLAEAEAALASRQAGETEKIIGKIIDEANAGAAFGVRTETRASDAAPSHPQASRGTTEEFMQNNILSDEDSFDWDKDDPGSAEESIDSRIDSLLDSLPPLETEIGDEAASVPELNTDPLRVDLDSVLETSALDTLDEAAETTVASAGREVRG